MIELTARAPFDPAKSLAFLGRFSATATEQLVTGDRFVKAVRVCGRTVVAELDTDLRVEPHATGGPLTAAERAALADRLSFFLSLDDDLAPFYALADEDFQPVVEQLHGYHQVKFPSPLENLVWSILVQRNTLTVATRSKHALMGAFPESRLTVGDQDYVAFPDLDQLLSLAPDRLAELIRNARKSEQIHRAVRGFADADEDWLRTADYDQVRDFLLGLPGVGPWSAAFILIRGLGRMEHLAFEKQLLPAASRVYGRPVGQAALRDLADRYGPYQGYWGHYLRATG